MRRDMQTFWDQRADEDPFFFVDNRLEYGKPDQARFWEDGAHDLHRFLELLGVVISPDDAVLEIGCGLGRLTRGLAAQANSVRALDVSGRMLQLAQEHNADLTNVRWLLGDGSTLAGVDTASVDACVSHVVFQHIPDPDITLSYVREMGRVLRPGGWAGFQISNDPAVHTRGSVGRRVATSIRSLRGHSPRGQTDVRWCGSMVSLEALGRAASDGAMHVERVVGEGTQFCLVLTRRR